jgi:hypothetical protein
MKRALLLFCIWGLAFCGSPRVASQYLSFGMTVDEVGAIFGERMSYVAGRPGSEIYVVVWPAGIPSLNSIEERLYLQFRRGRLTGWKSEWNRRFWLF